MIPVIQHPRCVLLQGDSAELGVILPPNSIDAIVCDPPAGIDFMGKGWDSDKGGRDAWIAWLAKTLAPAFAALKPGGFALVWAIPRTSHWTAMALEHAGFEIRDRVSHLFGTGFPKSLNIAMAIDAHVGAEGSDGPMKRGGERLARLEDGKRDGDGLWGDESGRRAATYVPGSAEAAQWEDFGTALKPGCEDWWLARKPLEGTYAENVLAHGTGALNIGACRIGDADTRSKTGPHRGGADFAMGEGVVAGSACGRWPANVVLDESAAAELDAQSGVSKPKPASRHKHAASDSIGTFKTNDRTTINPADPGGGASRFFYVAKPTPKERDVGLEHLPVKSGGEATGRADGSAGVANPRAGAGRGGGRRNYHPTVKSIALMRWLCKLVTPPGGTVLDPFAGSGTTGVAALAEGFSFVGCEQSDDYIAITSGRLNHALKGE